MRFLRTDARGLVFTLRKREHAVLLAVLARYPCLPAGHQRLSRTMTGESAADNQSLLDEALAAQRAENQGRLAAFLAEPGRFAELKQSWHLTLTPTDADWLLQVLNDVRVGCWVRLGSPDFEAGVRVKLNEETAPDFWTMEAAAQFEHHLLEALGGGEAANPA
jgi:hypothetical protein